MKIVILEPLFISADALAAKTADLKAAGHEIVAYPDRVEEEAVIIERGLDADIVITGNLPLSANVISAWPKLKFLPVAFTGLDHIALDACAERDIPVINAQGYATDAVAELALGMMLSALRNLVPCDAATRQGKTRAGLVGSLLKGKTVGIVGTGAIGLRTAELCKAFGCKLLAFSRSQRPEAIALGMQYVSLETLLSQSDIISLHVPLVPETVQLIGSQEIRCMKPNAIVVNVARGGVLDSRALADALNKGAIGGAAIDVFETEPPLDTAHSLLQSVNTIVAPHVAFASEEAFDSRADIVFDHIRKWLQ
jgi:D-3-phosphoglycerate dehydrogenase